MKMLIGLVLPDAGQIDVAAASRSRSPTRSIAADLGIGMVHQHFSLVERSPCGRTSCSASRPARPAPRRASGCAEIGEHYGLDIDPDARVGDAHGRAAPAGRDHQVPAPRPDDPRLRRADVGADAGRERAAVRRAARGSSPTEGKAVALVSHKLDEILPATDEVTIMRHGRVVEHLPDGRRRRPHAGAGDGRPRGVAARRGRGARARRTRSRRRPPATSRRRSAAEPVACARASAARVASRAATARLLLDGSTLDGPRRRDRRRRRRRGQRPARARRRAVEPADLDAGTVEVDGVAVPTGRAGAMAAAGVGVIPEDRHDSGCVLDMTVAENLVLADPAGVARRGLHRPRRACDARPRELIARVRDQLRRARRADARRCRAATSSGSCWPASCRPTRRCSSPRSRPAASTSAPSSTCRAAAGRRRRGVGVLLISTELEEILALADRIVRDPPRADRRRDARAEADLERLGLLMGGAAA